MYSEEYMREDENKELDALMMDLIRTIGNEIHQSIQLEVDYPSKYRDGKLPILDLKVWLAKRTKDEKRVVMYEYYEKEISSKWMIHAEAALAMQTKRTILTQQLLRVLLNCSQDLPWEHKTEKANKMMMKLQYSGYGQEFRHDVAKSAISAFNKIVEEEEDGIRPMFRPRGFEATERKEAKARKKKEWYSKGGFESVIFVPATPQSELKKEYEKKIAQTPFKIKVVEKSGTQLKRVVQVSNPFRGETCNDEDCFVCSSGEKKNCRKNEIKYHIDCEDDACKDDIYHGETSRNGYTRGGEHMKSYKRREDKSFMWKHCMNKHGGEDRRFKMKIDRTFRKDPLLRQIKPKLSKSMTQTKHTE